MDDEDVRADAAVAPETIVVTSRNVAERKTLTEAVLESTARCCGLRWHRQTTRGARVLAIVKVPRYARPPLRGTDGRLRARSSAAAD